MVCVCVRARWCCTRYHQRDVDFSKHVRDSLATLLCPHLPSGPFKRDGRHYVMRCPLAPQTACQSCDRPSQGLAEPKCDGASFLGGGEARANAAIPSEQKLLPAGYFVLGN